MNIKGITGDLLTQAKAEAILEGKTLREWVTEAMRERLNGADKRGVGAPEGIRAGTDERVGSAKRVHSSPQQYVPVPGLPMVQAGGTIAEDREHDPKTCRVYRCAKCISLGKKF